MCRATSPAVPVFERSCTSGGPAERSLRVTVGWTLPAHEASGTAFWWNENSMPFRAGTAVIWDADALRMSRGAREMKNLFQRETVNEVISRIDEFQPLSRRQWGMEVVVSDGRLLSTRWENWRSGWNRTLSSTVRTHLSDVGVSGIPLARGDEPLWRNHFRTAGSFCG